LPQLCSLKAYTIKPALILVIWSTKYTLNYLIYSLNLISALQSSKKNSNKKFKKLRKSKN